MISRIKPSFVYSIALPTKMSICCIALKFLTETRMQKIDAERQAVEFECAYNLTGLLASGSITFPPIRST